MILNKEKISLILAAVVFQAAFAFNNFASELEPSIKKSPSADVAKSSLPIDPEIIKLPLKPNPPVLNQITTPAKDTPQTISGTKDKGTSVWLNSQLIIEADSDTNWSYELPLKEGNNPISLTCKNKWNKESDAVVSGIFLDTQAPAITIESPEDGEWVGKE